MLNPLWPISCIVSLESCYQWQRDGQTTTSAGTLTTVGYDKALEKPIRELWRQVVPHTYTAHVNFIFWITSFGSRIGREARPVCTIYVVKAYIFLVSVWYARLLCRRLGIRLTLNCLLMICSYLTPAFGSKERGWSGSKNWSLLTFEVVSHLLKSCTAHESHMWYCYAGCECSINIPQWQSTQSEVVAIFVMDTEIRKIYSFGRKWQAFTRSGCYCRWVGYLRIPLQRQTGLLIRA